MTKAVHIALWGQKRVKVMHGLFQYTSMERKARQPPERLGWELAHPCLSSHPGERHGDALTFLSLTSSVLLPPVPG